jgi:hypothetical protein
MPFAFWLSRLKKDYRNGWQLPQTRVGNDNQGSGRALLARDRALQ